MTRHTLTNIAMCTSAFFIPSSWNLPSFFLILPLHYLKYRRTLHIRSRSWLCLCCCRSPGKTPILLQPWLRRIAELHLLRIFFFNLCQVDLIVVPHEGRKAGQKNVANDSKRPHVCNVDSIVMILMMVMMIMMVMMMMMVMVVTIMAVMTVMNVRTRTCSSWRWATCPQYQNIVTALSAAQKLWPIIKSSSKWPPWYENIPFHWKNHEISNWRPYQENIPLYLIPWIWNRIGPPEIEEELFWALMLNAQTRLRS